MTTKRNHLTTLQGELQGQGLNIPDTDIYAGPLNQRMPDACVYMVETGGPSSLEQFDRSRAIQTPTVQVRIRHDDYTLGKSDADDAWAILHDMEPADYSPVEMRQSGPLYLGQDDDARHDWSINVELFIYE